jgi:mono/diheme cytochrome c family protein
VSIEMYLGTFHVDFSSKSGRELYVTYCSSCHGDTALGTSTFSGSIQGYTPIHDIVRDGRREMKGVDIPDSVIAKIQDYLLSLKVDLSKVGGAEYFSRECAKCHGSAGEGTTRGYEIRNPVTGYATWVIRNGRSGKPFFADSMPKYTASMLSDQQLTGIITMLRAAPHPTDGKALYDRFCANCHGADAHGGPVGKNILRELGELTEKVREGEGGNSYGSRSRYMPKWSTSELSNAEVNAISSYLRTLR